MAARSFAVEVGDTLTTSDRNREVLIGIPEVRNVDREVSRGSGREVVGGDREEVVSSGGEEVGGGCSWADVRGSTGTRSVTPPPHSDLCAAAERAGRSSAAMRTGIGWHSSANRSTGSGVVTTVTETTTFSHL